MKTQRQQHSFSDAINHGFDFNRLRVSLSAQRQEEIARVLETFVGRSFVSSDGVKVGRIIDILISDWDRRAKYLKCRVDPKRVGKSPRLVYYPIKFLNDLSEKGISATHSLRELLHGVMFQPAAVRRDELFPLVSLLAYVRHANQLEADIVRLH